MGLLREADVVEVRERLRALVNPVTLVHFTQEVNLEYGREARQLLEELAQISDKTLTASLQLSSRQRDASRNTPSIKSRPPSFATARTTAFVFLVCPPGTSSPPCSTRFWSFRGGIRDCSRKAARSWPNSPSRFTCKFLPPPLDPIARRPCAWPTNSPWKATLSAPMALKPPNSRTSPKSFAFSPSPGPSSMAGLMWKASMPEGFFLDAILKTLEESR